MIVLLIVWLVVLTAAFVVGGLMVIGKFARVDRDQSGFDGEVFDEFEKSYAVFKNLQSHIEIIERNLEDSTGVYQQVSQIENRIAQLQETQEGLRKDVNLLLRGDDERPVLAPVAEQRVNRGGRPKKDGNG